MELSTAIHSNIKPQYKILEELVMYHDQIDTMLADEPDAVVKELIIAENIMVNSDKLLADAKY